MADLVFKVKRCSFRGKFCVLAYPNEVGFLLCSRGTPDGPSSTSKNTNEDTSLVFVDVGVVYARTRGSSLGLWQTSLFMVLAPAIRSRTIFLKA